MHQNPLITRPARPLPSRVAIVGAGTIGPDIGYYLKSALPDMELVLIDIRQAAIDGALERLAGYAAKGVKRGKMSEAKAARVLEHIEGTTDYAALAGCDWVLEAATENLPLKHRIFSQVEEIVGPVEDEFDTEEPSVVPDGDRQYIVLGSTPIGEVERALDLELDDNDVDTISGLLVSRSQKLPVVGDRIKLPGAVAEVLEVNHERAIRIRLSVGDAAADVPGAPTNSPQGDPPDKSHPDGSS